MAILPALAGITGSSYLHPAQFEDGFRRAAFIAAAVCACGGILAFATIRNPRRVAPPVGPRERHEFSCPLDAPPLRVHGRTAPAAAPVAASKG